MPRRLVWRHLGEQTSFGTRTAQDERPRSLGRDKGRENEGLPCRARQAKWPAGVYLGPSLSSSQGALTCQMQSPVPHEGMPAVGRGPGLAIALRRCLSAERDRGGAILSSGGLGAAGDSIVLGAPDGCPRLTAHHAFAREEAAHWRRLITRIPVDRYAVAREGLLASRERPPKCILDGAKAACQTLARQTSSCPAAAALGFWRAGRPRRRRCCLRLPSPSLGRLTGSLGLLAGPVLDAASPLRRGRARGPRTPGDRETGRREFGGTNHARQGRPRRVWQLWDRAPASAAATTHQAVLWLWWRARRPRRYPAGPPSLPDSAVTALLWTPSPAYGRSRAAIWGRYCRTDFAGHRLPVGTTPLPLLRIPSRPRRAPQPCPRREPSTASLRPGIEAGPAAVEASQLLPPRLPGAPWVPTGTT